MSLTLVTGPIKEPVTLAELQDHLRIDGTDDDALLMSLNNAARRKFESDTGRRLINQSWNLVLDEFPGVDEIILPYPPLSSVTSVTYNDVNSASQTYASTNYKVDTDSEIGRIVLRDGQSWPSTDDEINAVTVLFVAGYGANPGDVPEEMRHAIKFLVGHWYENRIPVITGTIVTDVPESYESLMWSARAWIPT